MCGIWAYILRNGLLHGEVLEEQENNTLKNRGPDNTVVVKKENIHMVFHRLAINGLSSTGDQPFTIIDEDGTVTYIMCNGEIYNSKDIIHKYNIKTESDSDCEVLCYLLKRFWNNPFRVLNEIRGEYAIVAVRMYSDDRTEVFAARDPFGVRPLYWSTNCYGLTFSSLLSGIMGHGKGVHFPPGHYISGDVSACDPVSFYTIPSYDVLSYATSSTSALTASTDDTQYYKYITRSLVDAVSIRLTSDRELGFLLSGGLDSSLVVGIATRVLEVERPKTFSVGMEGSSDLLYARKVADFLGTDHTEVLFTLDEAIQAIPEVIKCLETYDITTIRASIGSFLLAKYIKNNTNVRVLLNGDGSDEVACGYLYNYYAPSADEAHSDAIRLLEEIHMYDGLRVDRTISYNGIEARVPFLDPMYVETYLSTPASLRIPTKERMEKHLLRHAFWHTYPDILPHEIMFRRKEAFSDGVSAKIDEGKETMIQRIKKWAADQGTTEPDMYKTIFDGLYPDHKHIIPRYWMPRWTGAQTNDPSATTLSIYSNNDTKK
jgi:asparagine synthase (glutamine-hydrolysing)